MTTWPDVAMAALPGLMFLGGVMAGAWAYRATRRRDRD